MSLLPPWVHWYLSLQRADAFVNIQHDTTRLFFINSDAPAVAKRGEMMGIRIAVHSYWSERIEVRLKLKTLTLYVFVYCIS